MDPRLSDELAQQCPHCGIWQTNGDQSLRCSICDGALPSGYRPRGNSHPVLYALIRVVQAYRIWSVILFLGAVIRLLQIGGAKSFFFGFIVLLPFSAALGLSFFARSRWLIAFLVLVDIGVILAPAHQLFPGLNFFPELPLTASRMISWYILVYVTLQFVVAPPIVLGRSLRIAWRGEKPPLAVWICVFGSAVWGLLMFIIAMSMITAWKG